MMSQKGQGGSGLNLADLAVVADLGWSGLILG